MIKERWTFINDLIIEGGGFLLADTTCFTFLCGVTVILKKEVQWGWIHVIKKLEEVLVVIQQPLLIPVRVIKIVLHIPFLDIHIQELFMDIIFVQIYIDGSLQPLVLHKIPINILQPLHLFELRVPLYTILWDLVQQWHQYLQLLRW